MSILELILLIAVFFVTSAIGVVTGSNSLIAVPVMFQVGIPAKNAVATNMFALVFMSVGGAIPFLRKGHVDLGKISPLLIITAVSSACGALLAGVLTDVSLKLVVSVAMIAVALFTVFKANVGVTKNDVDSHGSLATAFILTFLLGIYGGLFSGGYVTILTLVLTAFFGMTLSESVASTKVINVVSSSIASTVFMWQGLVFYGLGVALGITMFVAAFVGAHYATKLEEIWLKRIFIATVLLLAVKSFYDLAG